MADAGKIMIMPKGAYDAGVSYEILDLVVHNDKAWVAKRNVIGVEPSEENSDDWFLMINNSGLEAILDGTTPVGNALKLGGKDASEYMEVAKYQPIAKGALSTSILEKAVEITEDGVYEFKLSGGYYNGGDLPNDNYGYSTATVRKRNNERSVILWGIATSGANYPPIMNFYNGGTWLGWKTLFTTDGGNINGSVSVKALLEVFNTYSNLVHIRAKNNSHSISMHVSDAGNAGLYDDTHSKWLLKSNSNGNVTLDGCRVTRDTASPLELESTSATSVWESFYGTSGYLGRLGFSAKDTPAFMTSGGGIKELLHTGNKPKGTYTGNGSATQRIISTGTTLGNAVLINSSNGFALLTAYGAMTKEGGSTSVGGISWSECSFSATNGDITLKTTSNFFNKSGETYTWRIL